MELNAAILDASKGIDANGLPIVIPDDKKVDVKAPVLDEDGLTPDEAKQARQFYRGLKDPEKAPQLLDFIATQAGYTKIETKAELKEAKKDISAQLLEGLGDEYAPLVEKLGPALEKILKEKLEESQKDIRADIDREKNEKIQNESTIVLKGLAKEFHAGDDLPENVANEMKSLMNDFEPSKNMTMDKYLKQIHTLAMGNLGLTVTKNSDKVTKNRDDVATRLTSERGAISADGVSSAPKRMSLDESVKAAMAQLDEDSKK